MFASVFRQSAQLRENTAAKAVDQSCPPVRLLLISRAGRIVACDGRRVRPNSPVWFGLKGHNLDYGIRVKLFGIAHSRLLKPAGRISRLSQKVGFGLLVAVVCVSCAIAMDVAGGPDLLTPGADTVVRLPPVEAPEPPDVAVPATEASDSKPLPATVPIGSIVTEEVVAEPAAKPWEASFEVGIDGSGGNSETFNFRLGVETQLEVSRYVLEADLDYRKNTADWKESANRALLDWQCKRLFGESPWSAFVHGTVEYDEFCDFDLRVAANIGVARELLKSDAGLLSGKFGGGFSREIGLPSDYHVPELVFGLDFEHRFNKRQKLTAKVDYMPDVTDFADFRINSEAAWEVLIDRETNLTLKTSVLNRYDSTPGTSKANDVDYSVVLLWSF